MKFKKLDWWEGGDEDFVTIFGEMGFVSVIVFKDRGQWHLHYETRDPSEHIFTGHSKKSAKDFAQELHNKNLAEAFIDEK